MMEPFLHSPSGLRPSAPHSGSLSGRNPSTPLGADVALRAQLSVCREENRQLRALLKPRFHAPRAWHLTGREECVCLALLEREVASKDYLYACLYDVWHEGPEPKIIDVFICNLRRKVAPYHFHIETVHARGYMVRDRHIWRRQLGLS